MLFFYFYPGLRDTLGLCLLDQLHFFFYTLAFVIRWAFASWTSSLFFLDEHGIEGTKAG